MAFKSLLMWLVKNCIGEVEVIIKSEIPVVEEDIKNKIPKLNLAITSLDDTPPNTEPIQQDSPMTSRTMYIPPRKINLN